MLPPKINTADKTQQADYDPAKLNAQDYNTLKSTINALIQHLEENGTGPANQAPVVGTVGIQPSAPTTTQSITLTVAANDPDGTITGVVFKRGTTLIGTATLSGNVWTYSWQNAAAGTYNVVAVATDDKGLTKTSAATSVTVTAASTTPTKLSAPGSPQATATGSTTVSLSQSSVANASGYVWERATAAAGPFVQVYAGAAAGYSDTGRTAATTYYYRGKATGNGGTYTDSDYGTVVSATTQAAPTGKIQPSVIGCSIDRGYRSPGVDVTSWPELLVPHLPANYGPLVTMAQNGKTVLQYFQEQLGIIKATLNNDSAVTSAVLLVGGPENDLAQNVSSADIIARYQQIATDVATHNANGGKPIRLLVRSALPTGFDYGTPTPAVLEQRRQEVNAHLLANHQTMGYLNYVNHNGSPELYDPGNTDYYAPDELHLEAAGYAVMEADILPYYLATGAGDHLAPAADYVPDGPIEPGEPTDPPAGFTGLVAPSGNYSQEYNSRNQAYFVRNGTGVFEENTNDPRFWSSAQGGLIINKTGDYVQTVEFFANALTIQLPTFNGGNSSRIDIVRVSDGAIVATKNISHQGSGDSSGAVNEFNFPRGVYYLKVTCTAAAGALSGMFIKR